MYGSKAPGPQEQVCEDEDVHVRSLLLLLDGEDVHVRSLLLLLDGEDVHVRSLLLLDGEDVYVRFLLLLLLLLLLLRSPAISLGLTIFGEIFAHVIFFFFF